MATLPIHRRMTSPAPTTHAEAEFAPLTIPCGEHWTAPWFLTIAFVSVGLLAATIFAAFVSPTYVRLGAALTAGAWTGLAQAACWIARSRGRVEMFPGRFRVSDRNGSFEIRDADVTGIAVRRQDHYLMGRPVASTFRAVLSVAVELQERRFTLFERVPFREGSPLQFFVAKLQDDCFTAADRELKLRKRLCGEGWEWRDQDLFFYGAGEEVRRVPVASITAAETIEGRLCVWRHGESQAAVKLSADATNAWLLARLLDEELARPNEARSQIIDSSPLGRLLFEREVQLRWELGFDLPSLLSIVGAALCFPVLLAVIDFLAGEPWNGGWGKVSIVSGLFAVGVILIGIAKGANSTVLCCHERGVNLLSRGVSRPMLFSEMELLTFSSRREIQKGVYLGTFYELRLEPRPQAGEAEIDILYQRRQPDEQLEQLRDLAAAAIAERWRGLLAQGQTIPWTPQLKFMPPGLEYQPRGWWKRRKAMNIFYESVTQFRVEEDRFYLWTNFQERAVINERTTEPNFYPGLFLLQEVQAERR